MYYAPRKLCEMMFWTIAFGYLCCIIAFASLPFMAGMPPRISEREWLEIEERRAFREDGRASRRWFLAREALRDYDTKLNKQAAKEEGR